jgi:hypothetical protein
MRLFSAFRLGHKLPDFDQDQVKNEPMFFNADADFAWKSGGPITRAFLEAAPETITVFDSRVHMLMPGWFPCIPGWHHDDVPRSAYGGQPNYVDPEYRSQHVMAMINGDICPTEFAVGWVDVSVVPPGDVVYKKWHVEVEEQIESGLLSRVSAPSNTLVWFDDRSFHQGTRAVDGGFRWFGRASWETGRKPTNEIRRQVNVYLDKPMEGW